MTKVQTGGRLGRNLTEGAILKSLIAFALPMILTNVLQQAYSMADLMIIGKFVGDNGTVGVSVGGELSDFLTPTAMAFASAGQIYVAQLVGAGDKERIKKAVGTVITFMFLLSVAVAAVSIIFCTPILRLLNCPEDALGQARAYMIITALGLPLIFSYNSVCSILRAMGEAKRPLMFVLIAAVVNVFVDLLLVVVIPLEAVGTAIATVLSQLGALTAAAVCLYKNRDKFGFEFDRTFFRIDKDAFAVILRLGVPQLARVLLVRFSMMWVNANINSYGMTVSATNAIGNKFLKFSEIFIQGVDGATGAMIGQNLGAKKHDRAKKIVWCALGCTVVCGAVIIAVSLLIPRAIFGIFSNEPEVLELGVTYLRIMCIHILSTAFIGPFQGMVTGCGFVEMGFAIGVLDGVLCKIGFGLLFAHVLGLGAIGFFLGTACSRILPCLLCFAYFLSGKWRTRKLLAERTRR